MTPRQELASFIFRTVRKIYLYVFGSVLFSWVLVYLLLSQGIIGEGFVSDFPNLNLLRIFLWVGVVGCLLMIGVIKRRFLSPEALRRHEAPLSQYYKWHVIMWALGEAIAIFGFVLFLVAALLEDFLAMAGITLVILYWLRPKEADYHDLARQTLRT